MTGRSRGEQCIAKERSTVQRRLVRGAVLPNALVGPSNPSCRPCRPDARIGCRCTLGAVSFGYGVISPVLLQKPSASVPSSLFTTAIAPPQQLVRGVLNVLHPLFSLPPVESLIDRLFHRPIEDGSSSVQVPPNPVLDLPLVRLSRNLLFAVTLSLDSTLILVTYPR